MIVGAIGVANGWLAADWLAVIAVALAATFALGAPLNAMAHGLYARFHDRLIPWESADRSHGASLPKVGFPFTPPIADIPVPRLDFRF